MGQNYREIPKFYPAFPKNPEPAAHRKGEYLNHYEHYYKAVDENFCGRNSFQYEVGKEYTVEGVDDNGNPKPEAEEDWCNFSPYISLCIRHFPRPRVCEIEVLSPDEMSEDCSYNLRLKKWLPFYTAHRVKILRELSLEEICDRLEEENAGVRMLLKVDAPFEYLLRRKKEIRGELVTEMVLEKEYLTDEQKKELLPKKWWKGIDGVSGKIEKSENQDF